MDQTSNFLDGRGFPPPMPPTTMALPVQLHLLLSSAAVAASQNLPEPPRLLWASQPVRPNSTLLVQGHFPLGRATRAVLKALPDGPEANVSAAQDWESDTALYFRVPASFPDYTGLRLTVRSGGGGGSAPAGAIEVNTPRIKWTQGDAGASATPGGFLRLFGSALAFGQAGANTQYAAGTYGDYQMLESELNHALRSHDHVVIAEAAARLAQLGKALSGAGALSGRQTTLALVPVRGAATGSPRRSEPDCNQRDGRRCALRTASNHGTWRVQPCRAEPGRHGRKPGRLRGPGPAARHDRPRD